MSDRIGIFGGTFNPLHVGHLNSMSTVAKKVGLQKVVVVPTYQNPIKEPIEGPTAEQRLEMVKAGIEEYDGLLQVDGQEVSRGGNSYTVETLKSYAKNHKADDLFFIVGADVFYGMDEWKDLEKILEMANLVVTSRSGNHFPYSLEDFPKKISSMVADYDKKVAFLNSGRFIHFVRLDDIDVSATEVRKKIRNGQSVAKYLTVSVEEYIRQNGLYKPLDVRIASFEDFTRFCAGVLFEKKGINVRGFDLRELEAPTEFTLIASGTSSRHASSLGENVIKAVKENFGVLPLSIEGLKEGRWVAVDYGSLMVHIFYDYVRNEYRLEDIWRFGKDLGLRDPSISQVGSGS